MAGERGDLLTEALTTDTSGPQLDLLGHYSVTISGDWHYINLIVGALFIIFEYIYSSSLNSSTSPRNRVEYDLV